MSHSISGDRPSSLKRRAAVRFRSFVVERTTILRSASEAILTEAKEELAGLLVRVALRRTANKCHPRCCGGEVIGEVELEQAMQLSDWAPSAKAPGSWFGRTRSEHGPRMRMLTRRRVVAAQATYYLGTGLWPLLHRRSFEAITGPKVDFWLVETVGAVVASIGTGLALAAQRDRLPDELRVTAMTAAAGLALIDLVYVVRGRIRPVYLADAAVEGFLVVALSADGRDAGSGAPPA